MSKEINLDELLRSMHNAVLEAQKLTEQQHVRQLNNYFIWPNEDKQITKVEDLREGKGKAITWEIEVPSTHPNAEEGDTMTLKVPVMSLIPPTSIKIKNMVVNFKVSLKGFEHERKLKRTQKFVEGDPSEHKGPLSIDLGGIDGGFFNKKSILANVKIEFESGEPAESFLRINDHLVKSIT